MKKYFERIIGIIIVFIIGYQHFCYADVVMMDVDFYIESLFFLIGIIGVIVLLITSVSFLALKTSMKDKKIAGKPFDDENTEKIKKKEETIQGIFFIFGIISSAIVLYFFGLSDRISGIVIYVPLILLFISGILKLFKKNKISNILCAVSIVLVFLIGIYLGITSLIMS